jgi:hypothetical protein
VIERQQAFGILRERYTAAEIVDIVNLTPEELLDTFGDLVYSNITDFELVMRDLGLDEDGSYPQDHTEET